MKKATQKLTLARQHVRVLTRRVLHDVAGGGQTDQCVSRHCCWTEYCNNGVNGTRCCQF